MTGLEKIVYQIKNDSDSNISKIRENARVEVERIMNEAMNEAEAECAAVLQKGKDEVQVQERIFASTAEHEEKKMLLTARREVIEEVFEKTLSKLRSLPAKEYFAVLSRLAVRYAEAGEGEMLLSAEDRARVPADFIPGINALVPGKSVKLADDTVKTDGGFILRYGGIEINCTFASLIDGRREQLGDKLSRFLFA